MSRSKPKATTLGRRFRGLDPAERQHQRREQFIEAGLNLFGAKGFHAIGVRDLCGEARLTERYFYESFANREALFQAVYDRAFERIREAVTRTIASSPRDVRLMARAAIRGLLQTLRDDPRLSRILLIDVLAIGADVSAQSRLATQSLADLTGQIIQSLYPGLARQQIDTALVASGLVGSTLYLVMQWAFTGFREPMETIVEHCALFYDALATEAARLLAEAETPARR